MYNDKFKKEYPMKEMILDIIGAVCLFIIITLLCFLPLIIQ